MTSPRGRVRSVPGEHLAIGALLALHSALALLLDTAAEEDAFIYYRYAAHWVQGFGLVFNVGEWVEGYSSVLWMGVLVAVASLEIDLPTGAPLLSTLCGAGTILATRFLARALGLAPRERILACVSVAVFFPFLGWSRSGLDTACYALLLTGFASLYIDTQYPVAPSRADGSLRQSLGGVLLLLIALCRPEGMLLAVAVAADRWLDHRNWIGLRRYLAPWALGYGLFLVLRYVVYGAFTPNTSVKFNPYNAATGLNQTLQYLLQLGGLPLVLAIWHLRRRLRAGGARGPLRFLVLAVLLVSVSFQVLGGGDYRPGFRYLVPTLPLLVTASWLTLSRLVDAPPGQAWTWRWHVLAAAMLLLPSLGSLGQNLAPPHTRGWPNPWRDPLSDDQDYHAAAARWVLANIPQGSTIAFGQMGKTPYYALVANRDLTFIDTLGLLDARLSHLLGFGHKAATFCHFWGTRVGIGEAYRQGRAHVHSQVSGYLLRERRPDFIIIESALLQNRSVQTLRSDPDFSRLYALHSLVPSQDQPSLLVYARAR